MNLARFRDMLAIHGARPERWPDAAAAQRLLAKSPEARAALAEAGRVDRVLDGFSVPIDPTAMARLRGTVQRRVARLPAPASEGRWVPPWRSWSAQQMLLSLSLRFGALAAMAAVGVWIGWAQPQPLDPASADPLAPIQLIAVADDLP